MITNDLPAPDFAAWEASAEITARAQFMQRDIPRLQGNGHFIAIQPAAPEICRAQKN